MLTRSSKPNPGDPPKPTPLAYARNSDKDDTGYPMINLCKAFFDRRSLGDAVTYGKALNSPANLRPSNYDNRAQTFFVSALEATEHREYITDWIPARDVALRSGC